MKIIRNIKSEFNFARVIWDAEKNLPRVFREASLAWTKDFDEFKEFWASCFEIWGLLEENQGRVKLLSCVYLQLTAPDAINIHLSVVEGVSSAELIEFFSALRRTKQTEGIVEMEAWLLKNNRSLRNIIEASGFNATGANMDFGECRSAQGESVGNVLSWVQYRG